MFHIIISLIFCFQLLLPPSVFTLAPSSNLEQPQLKTSFGRFLGGFLFEDKPADIAFQGLWESSIFSLENFKKKKHTAKEYRTISSTVDWEADDFIWALFPLVASPRLSGPGFAYAYGAHPKKTYDLLDASKESEIIIEDLLALRKYPLFRKIFQENFNHYMFYLGLEYDLDTKTLKIREGGDSAFKKHVLEHGQNHYRIGRVIGSLYLFDEADRAEAFKELLKKYLLISTDESDNSKTSGRYYWEEAFKMISIHQELLKREQKLPREKEPSPETMLSQTPVEDKNSIVKVIKDLPFGSVRDLSQPKLKTSFGRFLGSFLFEDKPANIAFNGLEELSVALVEGFKNKAHTAKEYRTISSAVDWKANDFMWALFPLVASPHLTGPGFSYAYKSQPNESYDLLNGTRGSEIIIQDLLALRKYPLFRKILQENFNRYIFHLGLEYDLGTKTLKIREGGDSAFKEHVLKRGPKRYTLGRVIGSLYLFGEADRAEAFKELLDKHLPTSTDEWGNTKLSGRYYWENAFKMIRIHQELLKREQKLLREKDPLPEPFVPKDLSWKNTLLYVATPGRRPMFHVQISRDGGYAYLKDEFMNQGFTVKIAPLASMFEGYVIRSIEDFDERIDLLDRGYVITVYRAENDGKNSESNSTLFNQINQSA
jgi:hypothetical protein